jgi:hypothetical protein
MAISHVIRALPAPSGSQAPLDPLLDGLGRLATDGHAASTPHVVAGGESPRRYPRPGCPEVGLGLRERQHDDMGRGGQARDLSETSEARSRRRRTRAAAGPPLRAGSCKGRTGRLPRCGLAHWGSRQRDRRDREPHRALRLVKATRAAGGKPRPPHRSPRRSTKASPAHTWRPPCCTTVCAGTKRRRPRPSKPPRPASNRGLTCGRCPSPLRRPRVPETPSSHGTRYNGLRRPRSPAAPTGRSASLPNSDSSSVRLASVSSSTSCSTPRPSRDPDSPRAPGMRPLRGDELETTLDPRCAATSRGAPQRRPLPSWSAAELELILRAIDHPLSIRAEQAAWIDCTAWGVRSATT